MTQVNRRLDRAVLWLACGLYLAACALPATVRWASNMSNGAFSYFTYPGWQCLAFGWMAEPLAWLANPLALVGALLLAFRRPAGAAAFGAAGLVAGLLYAIDPPVQEGHADTPQVGYVFWVGSFAALTTAALIRRRGRPHTSTPNQALQQTGGA